MYSTQSSSEALLEVYLSANEPQMLRDEYCRVTKILDAEYKPESLDDVMKLCENLNVEEQHQLKILIQKYEPPISVCWNILLINDGIQNKFVSKL
jgi:hypothetical protein